MNTQTKPTKSVFLLFLLITLICFSPNQTFSQGPNAPEAASFEPVDATDMVNLLTGDFTYVLPVVNVPSPGGGYPIALSYHAGIGMDQEASWVGLGWSLNPGALNRGVNGYPDDWKNGQLYEAFYDVGGEETTHNLTLSYSSLSSGGLTFASSFSYNSNKGIGGSVSLGYGIKNSPLEVGGAIGINPGGNLNASINGGYNSNGVSASFSLGNDGFNANVSQNGLGIGLNSKYGASLSLNKGTLGVSLSSKGVSVSSKAYGVGVSQNFSFTNSVTMNDYNTDNDTQQIFSLFVPTGEGVFSIGYNKQKFKWHLNSQKTSRVSGVFHLGDAIKYACRVTKAYGVSGAPPTQNNRLTKIEYVDSPADCRCSNSDFNGSDSIGSVSCVQAVLISPDPVDGGEYFMDVNEVGVTNGTKVLNANNAMFPALDSYNVMAQGLSGSITPKVSRTGALLGLTRNHADSDLFRVNYNLTNNFGFQNSYSGSTAPRINFYFNNQYSSSYIVSPGRFINNVSASNIYEYHESNTGSRGVSRKRDGRVVSYYTLKDVRDGRATNEGLLLPKYFDFSKHTVSLTNIETNKPNKTPNFTGISEDAIVGFMINAPDGKTYHYSLPVFNYKTSTRTIGVIDNKPERESYFESTQDGYATHWLLTAVTGPDYKLNATEREYPDTGDRGYWVRFDYGKWSDFDVWKLPYEKEYSISEDNPNVKSKTYGIKDLYYLDRVKTKTHTAIFVKNTRDDDVSQKWERHTFFGAALDFRHPQGGIPNSSDFDNVRWVLPTQKPLRLDKIILVKNENDLIDKAYGNDLAISGTISDIYVNSNNIFEVELPPVYNNHKNIVDIYDNTSETLNNAIQVIDFAPHYNYSLVQGTPNSSSGRLTLNGLSFKGKRGVQIMPPYRFEYYNNINFDFNKKDLWGFYKNKPEAWSLNKIINPTGASIKIDYESDDYNIAAAETNRVFNKHLKFTFFSDYLPPNNRTLGKIKIKIEIDDEDPGTEYFLLSDYFDPSETFYFDMWLSVPPKSFRNHEISALDIIPQQANIISMDINNNSMIVEVDAFNSISSTYSPVLSASPLSSYTGSNGYVNNKKLPRPILVNLGIKEYSLIHNIISNKRPDAKIGGGLRVKQLSVLGNGNEYKTKYSYNALGANENPSNANYVSSGVISYQPFEENSSQTIAYGSELPTPTPMYEYVTVKNNYNSITNDYVDKTTYKFKVLDEKTENQIKFGDLFEISEELVFNTVNTTQNKIVNIKNFEIKNSLSCLGQILEINQYNNNNQLLSKTINNYASANEISKGVIQESYESYKEVNYENSNIVDEWFVNSSKRILYPSVLKSTTTIQGGNTSTTHFDVHDDITGMLLETLTEDSEGNRIKTKIVPAYTIPEYSVGKHSMASKISPLGLFDNRKKNMLTQVAANYTFLDVNNVWEVTSAQIQTWSNKNIIKFYSEISGNLVELDLINNIWRKHKTFVWNGDLNTNGTYSNFIRDNDNFNWEVGADIVQTNPKWLNTSTISKYDSNSSLPLEIKDVNNNFSSTKTDNQGKVLVVSNTSYTEMHYSGAESLYKNIKGVNIEYFDGRLKATGRLKAFNRGGKTSHTGNYYVEIAANQNAFEVSLPQNNERTGVKGKFKVSVWVRKGQQNRAKIKVGTTQIGFNANEAITAGDWVMLNGYITIPTAGATVAITSTSSTIDLDDFRLHPVASSMTSYVYNEWDELTFIIGSNNLSTCFIYDGAGRLIETQVEVIDEGSITGGFKKVSENSYNYKGR